MKVRQIPRMTGSPYTIRVQRSLADHTVIDASFIEPDDVRATERLALLMDAFDARMIATNEKIMTSTAHVNALVEARAKALKLNGEGTDGGSIRSADLSANP